MGPNELRACIAELTHWVGYCERYSPTNVAALLKTRRDCYQGLLDKAEGRTQPLSEVEAELHGGSAMPDHNPVLQAREAKIREQQEVIRQLEARIAYLEDLARKLAEPPTVNVIGGSVEQEDA
jgi:hypothetical protein